LRTVGNISVPCVVRTENGKMSTKRSNTAQGAGYFKFSYSHPIRFPRRTRSASPQKILQFKESPLQVPQDTSEVPAGRPKRSRADYHQDVLESGSGVIGPRSLSRSKLKRSMRGPQLGSAMFPSPGLPADCGPISPQNSRSEDEARIRICNDIGCDGIQCQVLCERAAKMRRVIDNSCLPTDSYTNAELQSKLRTQDSHEDTPLLTAVRDRDLDKLEQYLQRLKDTDAKGGTNSLKEILTIKNEALHTCLTLAAKQFYTAGSSGDVTPSLALIVQSLLRYCSSFPEIIMISGMKRRTAVHFLLKHIPMALERNDMLFFTVAESMVNLCPDVLTLRSDEDYGPVTPFEKLNKILATVGNRDITAPEVAQALLRFSDRLKYLCIKHGYDLGVLYKVGEGRP